MISRGSANVARRGRGRPRKEELSVREPCDAPVIELTSSSEDDEPPRPPVRKIPVKPVQSSKPPILIKRSPTSKPAAKPVSAPPVEKEKPKVLTDTEALLSILESNDDDLGSMSAIKEEIKAHKTGSEKLSDKKDNLFKSIEDELRSLHQLDDEKPSETREPSPKPVIVGEKRSNVEMSNDVNPDVHKVKENDSSARKDNIKSSVVPKAVSDFGRRVKPDKKIPETKTSERDEPKMGEVTKVHRFDGDLFKSNSQLKLPPEVLQAIKKRANLGRIEKIVEKIDSNKKSKYIVIFNKGGSNVKKKSSIEEEIEQLLKSLPEKPPPSKRLRVPEIKEPMLSKTKCKPTDFSEAKSSFSKLFESKDKSPLKLSDIGSKSKQSSLDSPRNKTVKTPSKSPGMESVPQDPVKPVYQEPLQRPEEPVRFTESPLGNEPQLPWESGSDDGFEKYFKITEKVIENHDSLDSESDYDEPEMLSHFKLLDKEKETQEKDHLNDVISVNNIANTIAREFPGWSVEPLPGSETICLVRLGMDSRGIMSVKKQIKIDSDYNVSVIVNHMSIPEYEGLYDSFDNIKQLVREIDEL